MLQSVYFHFFSRIIYKSFRTEWIFMLTSLNELYNWFALQTTWWDSVLCNREQNYNRSNLLHLLLPFSIRPIIHFLCHFLLLSFLKFCSSISCFLLYTTWLFTWIWIMNRAEERTELMVQSMTSLSIRLPHCCLHLLFHWTCLGVHRCPPPIHRQIPPLLQ